MPRSAHLSDGAESLNPGERLDLWLWAARFFKTRAQAAKACDLGRVMLRDQPAKPAREIRPGDHLRITTEGGEFNVEVLGLSRMRGPAAVAQTLYSESEESRARRAQAAAERKLEHWSLPLPGERPSKRDRRLIHHFRRDG